MNLKTLTAVVVAAAAFLTAPAARAQGGYQHDAADLQILETFRNGILSTAARDRYNMIPARVTMAQQRVERDACWGPYQTMRGAAESAQRQRHSLTDAPQRRAAEARADYDACLRSFKARISEMVAALILDSVSSGAYLGHLPGGAQARERVDLLCNNSSLVADAGACRRWFRDQFEVLDRQRNPDGYIGAPRARPIGVALFGPQNAGNGTGLVWEMLDAFGRGNPVGRPVGGGAVPAGRP